MPPKVSIDSQSALPSSTQSRPRAQSRIESESQSSRNSVLKTTTADDAAMSAHNVNAKLTFPTPSRHRHPLPYSSDQLAPQPPATNYTHSLRGSCSSQLTSNSNLSNAVKIDPREGFRGISGSPCNHGLPQFLPPAPNMSPQQRLAQEDAHATSEPPPQEMDFSSLSANYLNMLSQEPEDHVEENQSYPVPITANETLQALAASAPTELRYPNTESFSQYLTSPFDSPFDDFLETPIMDSADMGDALTSPLFADYGDSFGALALFSGMALDSKAFDTSATLPDLNLDELYSMPTESPITPNLDAGNSLYASPRQSSSIPLPTIRRTVSSRRPESLIPLDAPTQPRKYITPSSTSRKDMPIAFARKRARSEAFGDEEDQLATDESSTQAGTPTPTEAELIEAKRRQNTLAARKSRKRKMEYMRDLENSVQILTRERDGWKSRALASEAVLQHHGLAVPQHTNL